MMKTLEERLSDYRGYHLNPKNRITHYFGVPIVLFSIYLLLSGIRIDLPNHLPSFAWVALYGTAIYFLWLDAVLGLLITVFSLSAVITGQLLYQYDWELFWIISIAVFVTGWAIQFLGHHYEKNKPAFFKNILHLLDGPLFVADELRRAFSSKHS